MDGSASYDLIFLGLARDCEKTLPGFVQAVERLNGVDGLRSIAVVGEDGSRDGSREILEAAAAASGRIRLVDTAPMARGSSRLERMALGREILATEARAINARVVCVIDLDEPFLEALEPKALMGAVDRVNEDQRLFAVSATSRPSYYDLLAFESDDTSFRDLESQLRSRRSHPLAYYRIFRDVIYPEQMRLTSRDDILCRSAFNGLALYQSKIYARGSYLPSSDGPWICEHITFHRSLAAVTGRGGMVVDSRLVLPMPTEHGRRGLPGFAWQRVRSVARSLGHRERPSEALLCD